MDIYEAIHHRRSHRMYKPEMPPKAALERVIDAALWAPSGHQRPGLGDHRHGRQGPG